MREIIRKLMEENRDDEYISEIMEDEELAYDFMSIMEANAAEFLEDNFNILFQLSLLQWGGIIESQEEELEELAGVERSVEEFLQNDPNEIDVLQMAAALEE